MFVKFVNVLGSGYTFVQQTCISFVMFASLLHCCCVYVQKCFGCFRMPKAAIALVLAFDAVRALSCLPQESFGRTSARAHCTFVAACIGHTYTQKSCALCQSAMRRRPAQCACVTA